MEPFVKPVDKRDVIDYYDIIANPMSIQCIRDKLREHKYQTRDVFLEDIDLIFTNCRDYNGINSPFTLKGKRFLSQSFYGHFEFYFFIRFSLSW